MVRARAKHTRGVDNTKPEHMAQQRKTPPGETAEQEHKGDLWSIKVSGTDAGEHVDMITSPGASVCHLCDPEPSSAL